VVYEGVDWLHLAQDHNISFSVAVPFEHRPTSILFFFFVSVYVETNAHCDVVTGREAQTLIILSTGNYYLFGCTYSCERIGHLNCGFEFHSNSVRLLKFSMLIA
jgi:hypothetical protein